MFFRFDKFICHFYDTFDKFICQVVCKIKKTENKVFFIPLYFFFAPSYAMINAERTQKEYRKEKFLWSLRKLKNKG